MDTNEIINRISYFRNKLNLSARELSLRIDKNGAYINHLESSKFNIKVSVLLDILNALEVSCDEFFADNFTTYQTDKELTENFEKLSENNKKTLLELMKNLK